MANDSCYNILALPALLNRNFRMSLVFYITNIGTINKMNTVLKKICQLKNELVEWLPTKQMQIDPT
jgi:hypothetical protein